MNRLVYLLFCSPLLLSLLTTVQAGPACARRNQDKDSCIQACKDKWGWSGFIMGTDRWGSVMSASSSDTDFTTVLKKACRVKTSTNANTASSATQSTQSSADRQLKSTVTPPINAMGTKSGTTSTVTSIPSAITGSASIKLLTSTKSPTTSTRTSSPSASSNVVSSTQRANPTTTTTRRTSTTTITSTRSAPTTTATPSKASSTAPPKSTTTKTTPTSSITTQTSTSTTAAPTTTNGSSGSSGSTSQSDINAYLQAHNSVRAQHGAAPLSWDDGLAAAAQKWANNCVFKHSEGTLGKFGENLAAGTGINYDISQAVKSWTDEVSDYDSNNPQPSHFTQVVWKASTKVGCAVQSCNGIFASSYGPAKFFVCEYSPQGNVIGQFAQNVQA